jgi:hypothetical protein
MVKSLYLDGCSFTYGQGIDRKKSLGSLFANLGDYNVLDNSRPGKSNMAIANDTYQNFSKYDVFILGFTYSSRFGIKYHNQNLDFFAGFHGQGLDLEPHDLDMAHTEFYKYFYSVFGPPYSDDLSNMLIDCLISFLISQNKKVLGFSWEKRNTTHQLFYPYIAPINRLKDGHLNVNGMEKLYHMLANLLNE